MDDKTWIDQPPLGYQEQEPPPTPPPPLMPPPPPPPESKFPRWIIVVLALVVGIFLCGLIGTLGYRLYQSGVFGLGPGGDSTPILDDRALTQTAIISALTEEVVESATLPPSETPAPLPTETATITSEPPTETVVPSDTLVPTPAFATYTVNQGLFCRTGPSTIYPDVRAMDEGQSSQIFARSISPVDGVSVWYQVELEGLRCYVSSGFGSVSGNLDEVPLIPAPPTPTPTPTSTPSNTPTPSSTPTP